MSYRFGVDVGGSEIKIVRLADDGQIESARTRTPADRSEFIEAIRRELEELGRDSAAPVGVALPAWLDADRRSVERSINLPNLEGGSIAAELEDALGGSVRLETDSNAGAIGEARLGVATDVSRVLFIALGTGVGAALTVDGVPVRVTRHTVGHVAELPIGPDRANAQSRLGAKSLSRVADGAGFRTLEEAEAGAARGDDEALTIWNRVGEDLGYLLEILVPLLAPHAVVIGGGVSRAAPHFIDATRALAGAIDLRIATRTPFSGALGAAVSQTPQDREAALLDQQPG